jgi:pimeloyl-ACP methyl ester carboxylesterase/DNA-binding CsgD family transcriptional regulator
MEKKPRQRIRYLRTADGVQLAWAEIGAGPVLIKAANWLSHLEYELESPAWGHWIRFFGDHFHFLRFDQRGCGLTDWNVEDLTNDRWIDDLSAVIATSAAVPPFALLGISQGAAICVEYAARHPELVSRMVLYGGYARGFARRGEAAQEREFRAIAEVIRAGWGKENPAFRQIFTARYMPGATEAQLAWFNELCRRTSTGEMAARLLESRADIDVSDPLGRVHAPTLVMHARGDEVCPIAEGRRLAAGIPGAQFVELESRNHILLEDEPAWARFKDCVLEFMGLSAPAIADAVFERLTARERQVLALMTRGLGNADIADSLAISEKTVRNHVSNMFDKLGVWTRAQAIVFARDRGFTA